MKSVGADMFEVLMWLRFFQICDRSRCEDQLVPIQTHVIKKSTDAPFPFCINDTVTSVLAAIY